VAVEFVGHPLIDLVRRHMPREPFLLGLGLQLGAPTVALLPGSRTSEVRRLLPTLVQAARQVSGEVPGTQFVVARAPHLDDRLFAPLRDLPGAAMVTGDTDAVLASADVVVTASGTATVQTALPRQAMVVVYRVSGLEYRIGRPLVRVDTFAMVNLIAGERLVPELIQEGFTADAVTAEVVSMLTDPVRTARIRQGLARCVSVWEALGPAAARRQSFSTR